jgi:serine/threonine protein kinase/cyclophilin family peptidyl-prolyl cis-trans isomerase
MDARLALHPSAQDLAAFGQGKLDDVAAEQVMRHLDGCADCRKAVAAQSGDDFLDRLRAAHGLSGTPMPDKSLSGVTRSVGPQGAGAISQTLVPNLPPELARHPDYEVLRELGHGGMGVVYLARHRMSGRREVLKVMNKEMLRRPGSKERFLREIQSAALLKHDYVVQMYTATEVGDLMVLVMEFVEGRDLAGVVQSGGPLPVALACRYAHQVALALQHASDRGMVHRDIKPENLILTREGGKPVVKVLDFGLAKVKSEKAAEANLTGEGRMLGTPHYMAPEQIRDAAHADVRADVYSLGCTLYCLLTGAPPFHGRQSLFDILQAHQSVEARPVNLARPEVPPGLAAVVAKMMDKDAAKRYQRPVEVAQALAPFVQGGQKVPPKAPPGWPREADASRTAPPAAVPASPGVWETLTDSAATSPESRARRAAAKRLSPALPPAAKKKWLIGAGVAAGALLLGLVVLWAAGVFRVKTKDGTIVLKDLPADAEVLVDGDKVNVIWDHGSKNAEIRVKPGKHKLVATKGGVKVIGEEVEIVDGGRKVVTARLEPLAKRPPQNPPQGKPDDFVPLFNGKDLKGWTALDGQPAQWAVRDGFVEVTPRKGDIMTKEKFGPDFQVRIEFWLPLMPDAKDQARANSGVFLQGRYEVQILDSYMNDTFANGSIGSLYGLIAPGKEALQKAIRPPEQWQTYDITFHAPRVNEQGKVTEKGRITVILNDITVINDGRFDKVAGGAMDDKIGAPGPIRLQDHGCKVRFRNIEIKELPPQAGTPRAADKHPVVVMKTSLGTIKIELYPDKAPVTVKNFLDYVDARFYDGTTFHRVIPNFVIQGGGVEAGKTPDDPKKTGEPIKNESDNGLQNERGTLAMARTPRPDSATSQFFINVKDNDLFDRANAGDKVGYCVFGKVIDGMDVVDKIKDVETRAVGVHQNVPVKDVVIESIRRANK